MLSTKPIAKRRIVVRLGAAVGALAVLAFGCSQSENGTSTESEPATSTSQTSLSSVTQPSPVAENTTSTSLSTLGTTTAQSVDQEQPSSSVSEITTTITSLAPSEAQTILPEETAPASTLPEEPTVETTLPEDTVPETTLPQEPSVEIALPEETVPETNSPEEASPISEIIIGSVDLSNNGSPLSVSLRPVHSRTFLGPPSWLGEQLSIPERLVNPPGDYLLELLDGSDGVLRSISFQAVEIVVECLNGACPESDEPDKASFNIVINDPPNYLKLRFSKQGDVFANRTRSANTPLLHDLVLSVPEPEALAAGEDILLTWSATDDDNDNLRYIVFYSVDSGRSYLVLSMNTEATSLNISADLLGGSDTARIAVSASDGLRSAFIESEIFSVPNKPPDAQIDTPNGLIISGRQGFSLVASGYDLEDGNLPSVAFSWSSNIDGDLGTGRSVVLSGADLTAGEHEITMTATDSTGNQVTDKIRITISK